ncbi:MAG TPA: RES superfamily protein [Prolixibacteraceae bacterium]|nr:RES superfamily protein [Prolixibacteraceae bacterium]
MEVFRLSREKFASILSGKGAAIRGARWNSIGVELIYSASNRSLAMAEVAVHFSLATFPIDYVMMTIFIPDEISLQKLSLSDLPTDWNAFPHPSSTQNIGDKFVSENKYCVLQIPSVVTQGDYNILINPNHPEFSKIKIIKTEKFPFDKRIFR